MTDSSTAPMGIHVRRFVRSAWLLLFVQFFAALIALGATGWAAFYVSELRAERDMLRAQLVEFTGDGLTEPAYQQPSAEEVELLDESVFDDGPDEVTDAPVETRTPPTNTQATREPATRTPAGTTSRTVQTDSVDQTPETTTPRRNDTYPGGLPGQGNDNSEPPFIQSRLRGEPSRGSTQTDTGGISLEDVANEIGQDVPDNPNRTQNPNYPDD